MFQSLNRDNLNCYETYLEEDAYCSVKVQCAQTGSVLKCEYRRRFTVRTPIYRANRACANHRPQDVMAHRWAWCALSWSPTNRITVPHVEQVLSHFAR